MKRSVAAAALVLAGCLSRGNASTPGLRATLPAPKVGAGELDARALLAELPARASRLGAGTPSLVGSGQALDNEWVGGFVDVPREECLLCYARGSSSIEDIDVAVYSEDGTSLAVDEGRDVHPTVLLCPPHPDRVYVAAHVVEGEGLVAVGAQLVPKERAVIVARALGARGVAALGPRPADAWPGLDDIVRSHRNDVGGTWEEFRRIALSVDARVPTFVSVPIDADQCVDVVVVPDEDVALLDVEVADGDGRTVAKARDGSGVRTLTMCSPIVVSGSLSVRPHVGRGLAAVVMARATGELTRDLSTRAEVVWAAATRPLQHATGERNALLAKEGYGAPLTSTSGALSLGRRLSVPLDLKSNGAGCSRVDLVAGAPLALVDASIWDDAGSLLASAEATSSLALFACGRDHARVDLEARGRPGPFALTVRPERWKDPAFGAHPLAASRMLGRAAAGPDMLLEGKEGPARELALDAARAVVWTEAIAPGRCLQATAGAQGEGAGLEMRVFEGDVEIDRSEGAHAASVRACAATDGPRNVRFDLRASAGRMAVVLGERTSGP